MRDTHLTSYPTAVQKQKYHKNAVASLVFFKKLKQEIRVFGGKKKEDKKRAKKSPCEKQINSKQMG